MVSRTPCIYIDWSGAYMGDETKNSQLNVEEIKKDPYNTLVEIQGMLASNMGMGLTVEELRSDARQYVADGVFLAFASSLTRKDGLPAPLATKEHVEVIKKFADAIGNKLLDDIEKAIGKVDISNLDDPKQLVDLMKKTPTSKAAAMPMLHGLSSSIRGADESAIGLMNSCYKYCQLVDQGQLRSAKALADKCFSQLGKGSIQI